MSWNPYDMSDHGVDFSRHSRIECYDFVCFHTWPVNWGIQTDHQVDFALQWNETHVRFTNHILRKPVILSEFGMQDETRCHYFSKVGHHEAALLQDNGSRCCQGSQM